MDRQALAETLGFSTITGSMLVHDKAMFAPIWELARINGVGPRVEESGLGLIAGHADSAPYEDVRVRK